MSTSALDFKVTRIHRLKDNGPMRAFVDMSVNEALVIRGLKVIEGQQGLFVSMPQEKGKDSKWYDTIRCLLPQVRSQINDCILEAYEAGSEGEGKPALK